MSRTPDLPSSIQQPQSVDYSLPYGSHIQQHPDSSKPAVTFVLCGKLIEITATGSLSYFSQQRCPKSCVKKERARQNAAVVSESRITIHCMLCPPSLSGQPYTIWKYNVIYHLAEYHAVWGKTTWHCRGFRASFLLIHPDTDGIEMRREPSQVYQLSRNLLSYPILSNFHIWWYWVRFSGSWPRTLKG